MYLPKLVEINNKVKKSIIEWAGLNRRALIADNQFSSTINLSSRNFPLISPRPSREAVYTLTSGKALFASSQLAWVDGTNFKFNNVTEGTVTASSKSMVELSQRIVVFPDKVSYDTVGGTFAAFGTGTYPTAGSVPDVVYACVLDNRIWGVDAGDNIYCTALGDFDDWTTFSSPSEATDAWQVDTGTNGNFTGIVSFKGTNLAFKLDHVWKRFGNIPSNFQFVEISSLGCINHKSIAEVNNILFWLSPQGVVAYTGGIPEIISENLNDNYISAVAGGDGRNYYLSLYDGSAYKLYVYDTWGNNVETSWMQEDTLNVTEFAYLDGYLYALASDNKVWKFGSGTEVVTSTAISKELTEDYTGHKGHSELSMRVDLDTGATLAVYVRYDNGSFTLVKSYNVTDLTSLKVPLKIKNASHFQIKLVMTGEYRIYQLQRKFIMGEAD
jgi:hypothetical protein